MVDAQQSQTYSSFVGNRLLAAGSLERVLLQTKKRLDSGERETVLIFEDESGRQVEFDLRGTPEEMLLRELPAPKPAGPGRPKLGVVSREVSLLPRHWDFLEQEPNGISAALRRLVEEASKREPEKQRARRARDRASRFMTTMAGNLPNFEEALRALFASDSEQFEQLIHAWPKDVREHLTEFARDALHPC